MEWKELTDKWGNPMLKFDDGTNRQMTLHYDNNGSITASHVKNPDGSREFINPADAELLSKVVDGARVNR